jgi:hypothetical protein
LFEDVGGDGPHLGDGYGHSSPSMASVCERWGGGMIPFFGGECQWAMP